MPNTFDSQNAHMRGRYTQYYDRNGVLQQGDPYATGGYLSSQWDEGQRAIRQRQSAAWRRKAFRTAAAGAAMFGGAAALSSILPSSAAASGAGAAGAAGGVLPSTAMGWAPYAGTASMVSPSAAIGAGAGGASLIAPAATRGALARMSSVFSHPGFETAANTGLAIGGMVSQNRANSEARRDALAREERMLALERDRLAAEMRNADLDREDARALHAAMQENENRRFALEQERLRFEREIFEQDRAYREPFRRTADLARQRLSAILGL